MARAPLLKSAAKNLHEHALLVRVILAQYRYQGLLNTGFILSLAIATSTLLSIFMLNHASKSQYARADLSLTPPAAFYVLPKQGNHISKSDFVRLRRAGFHRLTPELVFKKTLSSGNSITFKGLDLVSLALTNADYDTEKIHIGPQARKRLGLTPNQAVILADKRLLDSRYHRQGNWGSEVLIDIVLAWQLFPELRGFSQLVSPALSEAEQARLSQTLPPHLTLQTAWSLKQRSGFADALHMNLSALAILAFIVSWFIAFQAGEQAWRKRSELAARLRLLGVSLPALSHMLVMEALALILITSILGTGIAFLLVSALLPLLGLTLEQIYDLNISGQLSWHPLYALWSLLIAAVAVFTTLARQFRRMATGHISRFVRQASSQATDRQKQSSWQQAMPAAPLVLLLAFLLFPGPLPGGETGISGISPWHLIMAKYGLLLLASIALLPFLLRIAFALLRHLSRLSPFSRNFTLGFLLQDARSQVGRRRLPLAAFYLALTTSIAAALMINSFEEAFHQYLDQNLAQDLYIRFTPEQKPKLLAWIKTQANIAESPFSYRGTAALAQDQLDIGVYSSPRQLAAIMFKEKAEIDSPGSCFINEPLAIKRQLAIGQQITVRQPQASLSCRIQGIYHDYGNPGFELTLPLSMAQAQNFSLTERGLSLYLTTGGQEQKQQLIQALSEQLHLAPQQIIVMAKSKQLALKIFEQTFIITRAIALVLICIACLGLFLSANTLELARRSQLVILKSLGYSRGALFRFMLGQWLLMALGCIIISAPVAVILADTLVSKALPASFGWSMPLQLNAGVFLNTGLTGLLCLLPALLLPLYQLEPGKR
ncbi:FtsX-like permease family protein [Thalassomonas viridans]|uniref:FtsX-like permease family protein n=1 Tax=Thalassomonas viridans TaxID=137584 RepID=A0AAE9Z4V3_9GAMM|nr:FtsX-like permease family protein [Thalassomonas viridans]WDE06322.1 FtsX-like permease family protein [Thalassomonas viridans]